MTDSRTPPLRPLARDRSLSVLLDDAFALYRRHLGVFLLLAAGVVVPVDLIVGGIGLGQLTSGYDEEPTIGAIVIPGMVSALVTVPLITAMNVRAILAAQEGRTPTVGQVAREGLDLFTPVLVVVLLASLGVMLGVLALIVPGVILAVHWSVVAQVVTIEGTGGTAALRRSFELVRGDAWWVFGVLLVTNILTSLLAGIVVLPAEAAAQEADSALIALVATMISEVFTLSFLAITTTLLFFTLRARKAGIGTRPPAPEGWAAPHPGDRDAPTSGHGEAPSGWEPPRPGA